MVPNASQRTKVGTLKRPFFICSKGSPKVTVAHEVNKLEIELTKSFGERLLSDSSLVLAHISCDVQSLIARPGQVQIRRGWGVPDFGRSNRDLRLHGS